jgi:hypothetical protein
MNMTLQNVTWDTPREDSLGSMPLGNGDVGANVWATDDGAIHLYLSKTDAWYVNHDGSDNLEHDRQCRTLRVDRKKLRQALAH